MHASTRTIVLATTLFMIATTAATVGAQRATVDNRIQIGGINLILGTAQADVLRNLSAAYRVVYDAAYSRWDISEKSTDASRLLGSVSFRAERLVWVSKEWHDIRDDSASGHALSLANAIQAVSGENGRSCNVRSEREKELASAVVAPPSGILSRVSIIACGRHRIEITSSSDSRVVTSVREILE
jgi:hypothetical protein